VSDDNSDVNIKIQYFQLRTSIAWVQFWLGCKHLFFNVIILYVFAEACRKTWRSSPYPAAYCGCLVSSLMKSDTTKCQSYSKPEYWRISL